MKILITGGAGYIGSHTIIELLGYPGFEIISADSLINSTSQTFHRIKKITGSEVKNYPVDLTDFEATKNIFRENADIKGIIHFAALKAVGESVENPVFYYRNNLVSLLNLLECSRLFHCDYFIFSSSCTVYGNIEQLPVSEATPLEKAESPYGFSKLAGERILEDFCKANPAFSATVLRYFNPVGAHPSGEIGELPLNKPNNLVPIITQVAAGILEKMTVFGNDYNTRDGTCIRDYVHVSDIANAHALALEHLIEKKEGRNYGIFNLGTGKGVSVMEIIAAFERNSGVKLNYEIGPRRPGDVEAIYSDSSRAKKILGWKPRFSIDAMMQSAWKWQENLIEEQKISNPPL